MQTIARVFQCQALLHRWGRSTSHQNQFCRGEADTISHLQNWCPALKKACIAAHHALAAMKSRALQAQSVGKRQFHIETAVNSLRAIPVPIDLSDMLNRLIDDLEEPDSDTDRLEEGPPQDHDGTPQQEGTAKELP